MVKLRTTLAPLEELDVPPSEAADLTVMGVVLKSNATTEKGLTEAAIRQVTERTRGTVAEVPAAATAASTRAKRARPRKPTARTASTSAATPATGASAGDNTEGA